MTMKRMRKKNIETKLLKTSFNSSITAILNAHIPTNAHLSSKYRSYWEDHMEPYILCCLLFNFFFQPLSLGSGLSILFH